MRRTYLFIGICLAILLTSAGLKAQQASAGQDRAAANSRKIEILYTGHTMGYFRIPNAQPGRGENVSACAGIDASSWSQEAQEFDSQRKQALGAILVGTGDNFAPHYEARVFDPKLAPVSPVRSGEYRSGSKDLYYWYPGAWEISRMARIRRAGCISRMQPK